MYKNCQKSAYYKLLLFWLWLGSIKKSEQEMIFKCFKADKSSWNFDTKLIYKTENITRINLTLLTLNILSY